MGGPLFFFRGLGRGFPVAGSGPTKRSFTLSPPRNPAVPVLRGSQTGYCCSASSCASDTRMRPQYSHTIIFLFCLTSA